MQQKIRHGFVIEAGDGLDLMEKVRAFVDDCMQEGVGSSCYIRIFVNGARLPEDSDMVCYQNDPDRKIGGRWDEEREQGPYTKSYVGFSYSKRDKNKLDWYDAEHMNSVKSNLKHVLRNELPPNGVQDNRNSMLKTVDKDVSASINSFLMDLGRRRYGIYAYYEILDTIRDGAQVELQVNIKRPDTTRVVHQVAIRAKGSSGYSVEDREPDCPNDLEMRQAVPD